MACGTPVVASTAERCVEVGGRRRALRAAAGLGRARPADRARARGRRHAGAAPRAPGRSAQPRFHVGGGARSDRARLAEAASGTRTVKSLAPADRDRRAEAEGLRDRLLHPQPPRGDLAASPRRSDTGSACTCPARDRDALPAAAGATSRSWRRNRPATRLAELTRFAWRLMRDRLDLFHATHYVLPPLPGARGRHDPRHHPRPLSAVPAQPRGAPLCARDDPAGAAARRPDHHRLVQQQAGPRRLLRDRAGSRIGRHLQRRRRRVPPGHPARRSGERVAAKYGLPAAVPPLPRRREAAQERAERAARVRRGAAPDGAAARPRARRAHAQEHRAASRR